MAKFEMRYTNDGIVNMELWFLGDRFATKIRMDENGWFDLITSTLGEQIHRKISGLPKGMCKDTDEVLCTPGFQRHSEIMEFLKVLQEYEDTWGEKNTNRPIQEVG